MISFKKQVYKLSSTTVLLYQRDNQPDKVYYIDMSYYEIIEKNNGKILLKPIDDDKKRRKPKIWGYPHPDNLSIFFLPHEVDGKYLKN